MSGKRKKKTRRAGKMAPKSPMKKTSTPIVVGSLLTRVNALENNLRAVYQNQKNMDAAVKKLMNQCDVLNSGIGILHRVMNDALAGQTRTKKADRIVLEDGQLSQKNTDILNVQWYRTQAQVCDSLEAFSTGAECYSDEEADRRSSRKTAMGILQRAEALKSNVRKTSEGMKEELIEQQLREFTRYADLAKSCIKAIDDLDDERAKELFQRLNSELAKKEDEAPPEISEEAPEYPEGAAVFGGA
jgi:hypothetical protein